VHCEECRRHAAARVQELPAAQAEMLAVQVGEIVDPRLDLLLCSALRGREILTVGNNLSGNRRCRRCRLRARDEALLSFTKPSAHHFSSLVDGRSACCTLSAWRRSASGCFRAVSRLARRTFPPRSKIASQPRMTRRIQRSNLYDRKRSNPTAALSQTHLGSDRFQDSRSNHSLAEWSASLPPGGHLGAARHSCG